MERHSENALIVAKFLQGHNAVRKVYYPGLQDHPGYEINRSQAESGGGMISFELDSAHDLRIFFESLKLVTLAESLGGVESLICHPATMTHASIPFEIRQKVGITDNLIRLSVGIEDSLDIVDDLQNAIQKSKMEN
jgi:cystathionine beta-lyase